MKLLHLPIIQQLDDSYEQTYHDSQLSIPIFGGEVA